MRISLEQFSTVTAAIHAAAAFPERWLEVGGVPPGDFEQALLWVLNYCDGELKLLWIAERSRLGFARIAQAPAALEAAGLVREIDAAGLVRTIDQVGRGGLQ